jgi:hypothetical protein
MTGYYKSTWDKGSYTLTQFEVRALLFRIDTSGRQSVKRNLGNVSDTSSLRPSGKTGPLPLSVTDPASLVFLIYGFSSRLVSLPSLRIRPAFGQPQSLRTQSFPLFLVLVTPFFRADRYLSLSLRMLVVPCLAGMSPSLKRHSLLRSYPARAPSAFRICPRSQKPQLPMLTPKPSLMASGTAAGMQLSLRRHLW